MRSEGGFDHKSSIISHLSRERGGQFIEQCVLLRGQDSFDPLADLTFIEKCLLPGDRGFTDKPLIRDQPLPLPSVQRPVGDPVPCQQLLLGDQFVIILQSASSFPQ